MKRILTIVSDPLTFGRGHLTRQKRLAQILSDTGFEVTLIVNGDSLTTEKSHDLLILDLSDRDTSPPEKLLGDFKFVVGFDWCMGFVPDINFVVFQHVGKVYPSKIETYVGFEYIILNNRFEQSHRLNSPSAKKYQLISIGFNAKSQKILEVLDVATKISDLPIKICSGIELDLIHKELKDRQIQTAYLTGKTKNREAVVREFQENKEVKVFLISLKAGGTGLNLTEADYVYLVDPWWNPAVENQAIDRLHRIGQTKNTLAIRLICPNTIEDKIRILQESKKTIAEELITNESGFFKNLSKENLLDLLSDLK